MRRIVFAATGVWLLAMNCAAQTDVFTAESASKVFDEAARLSARDAGELWGRSLYGPMLLVDRETRRVFANESVSDLVPAGDVFEGVLPDSLGIANTALNWAGRKWTMLLWPLPDDPFDRRALVAHELWHRIQGDLGFPSAGPPNLHLGTRDGRVWLQLEWRALAAALRSSGGPVRSYVEDALYFRAKRLQLFPQASEEERLLLMHEGLAQYTGYALSGRMSEANHERAAQELESMTEMPSFIRSFAYPTGAAYGLLLDILQPGWRVGLAASDDLTVLTARAVDFEVGDSLDRFVDERLNRYDGAQLVDAEDLLESERLTRLSQYRQRYVDGPTLDLPFKRMSVQFDPGTVDALDDVGKVYPSLRLTDVWGELTVDGGALIAADWSKAVVPAPSAETATGHTGDGYVLTLNEGWLLVAGVRRGDRVVWQHDSTAPQEISLETGDGVTLFGDLYMAHGASAPLILLFHQGVSNARAEYLPIAPRLIDAGFNLLAIDQRRGGDRFGGVNRTVSRTTGNEYSYCDCYADLEAALRFARAELEADRIIAWGSSYSAALVFRLGVEHAEEIERILAFSPASGEPMDGCRPEPFASRIEIPALVLRPAREMELEHVAAQFRTLSDMGHRMYVADPAVHGSSMLNPNRVEGDIEPTWQTVLQFLAPDK